MLNDPLFILVALACLVVVGALVTGLSYFGRGGVDAAKKSNKMMQLRIAAQFVAVIFIVLLIYFRGGA